MAPLEALGFALAGYGCTTCIGNSGPLDEPVADGDRGERPGRRGRPVGQPQLRGPDPSARARELPRLAAARRRVRARRPGRHRPDDRAARHRRATARPVFLADIWPAPDEIRSVIADSIDPELFRRTYAVVFEGDERWRALPIPTGDRYAWDAALDVHREAAVLRRPDRSTPAPRRATSTAPASWRSSATRSRPTTSRPAGSIAPWSPAGQWLQAHGVGAARVQLVRRPARPPRGDDARHVRQHPAAQPAGRGQGGPVHGPPARRRGGVHLRRRDALPRRGRAAAGHRRPRVRLRARRATGRPRARRCSASGPSSPRATSGSTARTSSGWASCRSSSCRARAPRRSA